MGYGRQSQGISAAWEIDRKRLFVYTQYNTARGESLVKACVGEEPGDHATFAG
jgi:hypothetical protein